MCRQIGQWIEGRNAHTPHGALPRKRFALCGGGPPGKRNGQYRNGERTKAAIAEQRKFSALLKMLRAGLT